MSPNTGLINERDSTDGDWLKGNREGHLDISLQGPADVNYSNYGRIAKVRWERLKNLFMSFFSNGAFVSYSRYPSPFFLSSIVPLNPTFLDLWFASTIRRTFLTCLEDARFSLVKFAFGYVFSPTVIRFLITNRRTKQRNDRAWIQ